MIKRESPPGLLHMCVCVGRGGGVNRGTRTGVSIVLVIKSVPGCDRQVKILSENPESVLQVFISILSYLI